jgi:hypothetical protein
MNRKSQQPLVGSVRGSDRRKLEVWFIYYASFLCDFVLGTRTVKLVAYEI